MPETHVPELLPYFLIEKLDLIFSLLVQSSSIEPKHFAIYLLFNA